MAKAKEAKSGIAFLQASEPGFERAFNKLCARRVDLWHSVDGGGTGGRLWYG